MLAKRAQGRIRRKLRTRKKNLGTQDRARLTVYRSLSHFHAQVVDDVKGYTLLGLSTVSKDFKDQKNAGNVKGAKVLGLMLAKLAQAKKIKKVVFDRGGCDYHGRVQAFADGAREGGLEF